MPPKKNTENTGDISTMNTNNNTVNVTVNHERPKTKTIRKRKKVDKEFSLKSMGVKIIVGVVVTLTVGFITARANGLFGHAPLTNKEIKSGIMSTLKIYEADINKNSFDAEKYFAPDVELFFLMKHTTPAGINKYWKANFNKTFGETRIRYDESTLNIISSKDDSYYVSIVMYSDYFKISENRQVTNERSRFEFKFDSDFRIYYMRQFFN
ncbi:MAG TPA: hypothetical protein VFJ43_15740 [Bacteroidia bacterium]|nr:hypothetical protein [Bacteroidia bacterium]